MSNLPHPPTGAAISKIPGLDEHLRRLDTCQLCLEPGGMVNGEFIHRFSGRAECTYRAYL